MLQTNVIKIGDVSRVVVWRIKGLKRVHHNFAVNRFAIGIGALRNALFVHRSALIGGELDFRVTDLDSVHVKEDAELGIATRRSRRVRVPVNDSVVVTVNSGATETLIE